MPWRMVPAYKTFLGVPSESRALRTEKGRKVEQVAVEMLPVWGSRGFSGTPVSPCLTVVGFPVAAV